MATMAMAADQPRITIPYPKIFRVLDEPHRYKILWGGRGAAKSWTIARVLLKKALMKKERIGCFRELQASIRDSVHQVFRDQIFLLGMSDYFKVTGEGITCRSTGTEFLFKGLRHNTLEIKSTEGITIAWVEEAQLVTKDSWDILIPTIRAEGSEIWASFNPVDELDETYQRFVVRHPPDSVVMKVGWQDNPYFTQTQNRERLWMKEADPDGYYHVWEGECQHFSNDTIFRIGKDYCIDTFDPPIYPDQVIFHYGADWGFANDPTVLVRCWTTGIAPNEELWVDQEAYEVGCEIDDTARLFDEVPGSRDWPIKADCSRPETISYIRRQGFNISAAEKWSGCVEDRIAHLKGYKMIHMHQRCKHGAQEGRLYKYKKDKQTDQVLPVVIDAHNHYWDALGYALDGYIQRRGGLGVWLKM